MLCKFCNAEIEDDRLYCPNCGKRQDAQAAPDQEAQVQNKPADKDVRKLIVGIVAVLVVAGLLVMLFVMGRKDDTDAGQEDGTTTTSGTTTSVIEAPTSEYTQYAGVVVGSLENVELTNDTLQLVYMSMINSFVEDYGSSLSYFGLDMEEPLGEQAYPYSDGEDGLQTWEDFFLELALERWKNCVGIIALAQKNGYTLSDEQLKLIDEQIADLETIAQENNYESADAMIKIIYGDCCSVETYKAFLTMDTLASVYYSYLLEVTDEQIQECFRENEATLAEDGITKTSGLVSSVRHILIAPEGGTTDENNQTVYSDDEWEACREKAEQVLNEWKNGTATEASFSELVSEYTDDTASASTGGLYKDITRTSSYVEEFRAWAVDIARKEGDTALVKTQFGYHIMYFVSGEAEWIYYSRNLVQTENVEAMEEALYSYLEENPADISRDLIAMQNIYAR